MKLPNIRSTESNQMSMSRIFLQSVSLCLLFVKSSLFLKSPDYLFEESRLFVQSSGSKCTVYMCLLFVRSVSLRLKSLALLRAAIKSYSKLVLYSPKTGNIFSEKKKISTSDPQNHCLLGSRNRVAVNFFNRYVIYWVVPCERARPELSEYVWQRGVGSLEGRVTAGRS